MEETPWYLLPHPPGFFDRFWTDEEILTEGYEDETQE